MYLIDINFILFRDEKVEEILKLHNEDENDLGEDDGLLLNFNSLITINYHYPEESLTFFFFCFTL